MKQIFFAIVMLISFAQCSKEIPTQSETIIRNPNEQNSSGITSTNSGTTNVCPNAGYTNNNNQNTGRVILKNNTTNCGAVVLKSPKLLFEVPANSSIEVRIPIGKRSYSTLFSYTTNCGSMTGRGIYQDIVVDNTLQTIILSQ